MTRELRRLLGTPLYWLLFLGAVAFGGGLAWLQRRYRPGAYWIFIDQFWDKIGLAAVCAVVLTACLSLTACDRDCRTGELILVTRGGRNRLFWQRMEACGLGTALFAGLLSVGNLLCGGLLAGGLAVPAGWWGRYGGHTLLAAAGGGLLALAACALCDRAQSRPMVFAGVALVLVFSLLSPDQQGVFPGYYVLANGFFAKLIRGRALTGWGGYSPAWGGEWGLWSGWHMALAALCLAAAVRKRKERNQW